MVILVNFMLHMFYYNKKRKQGIRLKMVCVHVCTCAGFLLSVRTKVMQMHAGEQDCYGSGLWHIYSKNDGLS